MVLRQEGFTIVIQTMVAVAAAEDVMMMMQLMMTFVQGLLFGKHLLISQESQVVCC
jgi:EAL domain-containing protein (putative c-di-GMP-specific phosphodiesterase class I)